MPRTSLKPTVEARQPDSVSARGLEQLAWLMDRAFKIPGTNITIGLDALIGLLPIGGDFLTGVIQTGIVLVALYYYRVPRAIAARMVANVLLDVGLGSVPFFGDVFDIFFKANTRNLQLLKQVQAERSQQQEIKTWRSVAFLAFLGFALFIILGLLLIGFFAVVAWLFHRPLV